MHATTLSELRSFLMDQGIAPAAWSPGQDVLDAMYAALRTRRDDDVFWAEVRGLLLRVEDRGIRAALQGKAEVLEPETIDALVRALRISLPASHQSNPGWQALSRLRPLAAFLALGLAVGCGDKDEDEDCSAADDHGFSDDQAETFCDIVEVVEGSQLSSGDQADAIECIAEGYSEMEMGVLLEAFDGMSDSALATYLEDLLDECQGGGDDGYGTH